VLLQVVRAEPASLGITFVFVVPGHQVWLPRTFTALANRAAGGIPNRAYTLTITDGTSVVARVGAADAGTEPGTCQVTWGNTAANAIGAGGVGTSVAPLGPFTLKPGYVITGTIENPAVGDAWVSASCWTDFVYSD